MPNRHRDISHIDNQSIIGPCEKKDERNKKLAQYETEDKIKTTAVVHQVFGLKPTNMASTVLTPEY